MEKREKKMISEMDFDILGRSELSDRLNELEHTNFKKEVKKKSRLTAIRLTYSKEYDGLVKEYIDEYGKKELSKLLIKSIEKCLDVEHK